MKNNPVKDMAENTKKRPQELTRAELEIMQILWQKGCGLVHDILDEMPEPRPAYNTVSTIVRILEKKGFVGHTAYGKTHQYRPLVGREEYTEQYMNGVLGNFFDGSLVQMVSFFTRRDNIPMREFDSIIGILEQVKSEAGGAVQSPPCSAENSPGGAAKNGPDGEKNTTRGKDNTPENEPR